MAGTSHQLARLISATVVFILTVVGSTHAQWVQTNGPYGGNITAVAASGERVFVGTLDGVVFGSTNSGDTWTPVNTGTTWNDIESIQFFSDRLFVAGNGKVVTCIPFDTNSTWETLPFDNVGAFSVIGSDVYVVSDSAVYSSSDTLKTWSKLSEHNLFNFISEFVSDEDFIYFGGDSGRVFRSNDQGKHWVWSSIGLPDSSITELVMFNNTLYACIDGSGIYGSTDQGLTWTRRNAGLASRFTSTIERIDSTLYTLLPNEGVYTSKDGLSWTVFNPSLRLNRNKAICSNSSHVFLVADSGVYRVRKGQYDWELHNHGITSGRIEDIVMFDSKLFVGTNGRYVFMSADEGEHWMNQQFSKSSWIMALMPMDSTLYAGTDIGVYTVTPNNMVWSNRWVPGGGAITALAASHDTIYAGDRGSGIIRSTDAGATWMTLTHNISEFWYGIEKIEAHGAEIFVLSTFGNLWRSTDNGFTWDTLHLPYDHPYIRDMHAIGNDIMVSLSRHGLLRSSDHGVSWQTQNIGLDSTEVVTLEEEAGILYAGTVDGVYYSADTGNTWQGLHYGLTTNVVTAIGFSANSVIVGTQAGSIWKGLRPVSSTSVAAQILTSGITPPIVSIAPLPGVGMSTVTFTASHHGDASVRVIDNLGRTFTELRTSVIEPGTHRLQIDCSVIPSGLYLLQLCINNVCASSLLPIAH